MDSSIIEALRSVIQEELAPVKADLQSVKEDVRGLKEDVQVLKTDMQHVKAQLDRMEVNQNEDVIAVLQHMDAKLTDFRRETQINFKSLNRRLTAVETELSETTLQVETLQQPHT